MNIVRIDGSFYLVGGNTAPVTLYEPDRCAGIKRNATAFILVDMRHFIADHLIARLGMTLDIDLVGHGSARAKHGCFHSKNTGAYCFKLIYSGVLAENIISN